MKKSIHLVGAVLWLVLAGIVVLPANAAPAADSSSGFALVDAQPLFPEPFEQKLLRMARPEDQVVYLFRERMSAERRRQAKQDEVISGYLAKGLDRMWRVKSVELRTSALRDPKAFLERFPTYFSKLPAKGDPAAFSFFLSQLPLELTGLSGLAPSAREALQLLEKPAALERYAAQIAETPDFFKQASLWQHWGNAVGEKIDRLLARLQETVSLEDAILALHWISGNSTGRLAKGAGKLILRLQERIGQEIERDLAAELTVGLEPDSVVALEKGANGIVIKQALYRGRIRVFVKALQTVKDGSQLALFTPIYRKVQGALTRLAPSAHDARSRETIERMRQNLEQVIRVMGLRTRQSQAPEKEEITRYRQVEEVLIRIDPEGLLCE